MYKRQALEIEVRQAQGTVTELAEAYLGIMSLFRSHNSKATTEAAIRVQLHSALCKGKELRTRALLQLVNKMFILFHPHVNFVQSKLRLYRLIYDYYSWKVLLIG